MERSGVISSVSLGSARISKLQLINVFAVSRASSKATVSGDKRGILRAIKSRMYRVVATYEDVRVHTPEVRRVGRRIVVLNEDRREGRGMDCEGRGNVSGGRK